MVTASELTVSPRGPVQQCEHRHAASCNCCSGMRRAVLSFLSHAARKGWRLPPCVTLGPSAHVPRPALRLANPIRVMRPGGVRAAGASGGDAVCAASHAQLLSILHRCFVPRAFMPQSCIMAGGRGSAAKHPLARCLFRSHDGVCVCCTAG